MAIRPESRWWIVTLVLVALLFGLSALALDRPNVVWSENVAHCPSCGTEAQPGTRRCKACREEYDWVVAPDEDAPRSVHVLGPLEDAAFQARRGALGSVESARRVAAATGLTPQAAAAWLEAMGVGQCGWCGGTGDELALAAPEPGSKPATGTCRICQGRKRCISAGRKHLVRQGDAGAAAQLRRLPLLLGEFRPLVALEVQRAELARFNEEFLDRYAGTQEAQALLDPDRWTVGASLAQAPRLLAPATVRLSQALAALREP